MNILRHARYTFSARLLQFIRWLCCELMLLLGFTTFWFAVVLLGTWLQRHVR